MASTLTAIGESKLRRALQIVQFIEASPVGDDFPNWRALAVKSIESGIYAKGNYLGDVELRLRNYWRQRSKIKARAEKLK